MDFLFSPDLDGAIGIAYDTSTEPLTKIGVYPGSQRDLGLSKGVYQHFKTRNYYDVLGEGSFQNSEKHYILYRGHYEDPELGKNPFFIRIKEEFYGTLVRGDYAGPRFIKLDR